jgi:hypothetical protein
MKQVKIGDVMYIEMIDRMAVITAIDEFICTIEYIDNIGSTFETNHTKSWIIERTFKMDI